MNFNETAFGPANEPLLVVWHDPTISEHRKIALLRNVRKVAETSG